MGGRLDKGHVLKHKISELQPERVGSATIEFKSFQDLWSGQRVNFLEHHISSDLIHLSRSQTKFLQSRQRFFLLPSVGLTSALVV